MISESYRGALRLAVLTASLALAVRAANAGQADPGGPLHLAANQFRSTYARTDMVSNDTTAVPAAQMDPNLVNAWGIAFSSTSPFWINDNGAGLATLYQFNSVTKLVDPQPLMVSIPLPSPLSPPTLAAPTGIVFNDTLSANTPGFDGDVFIFDAEDGTISGWQPQMPPPMPDLQHAVRRVDNPQAPDAGPVYKGLALGVTKSGSTELFATNFRSGHVDVFDSTYAPVTLGADAFADPNLPAGYAPFGIANIDGLLYVTYALQDDAKHDDMKGPGHGFVDVFNTDGHRVRRLVTRGRLNSPWGIVRAPKDGFGGASGHLLIGNFGDGGIDAYDTAGGFLGQILDANGDSIAIDGLWSLRFGNGASAGPTTTLFFTAGPHEESTGLFGKIELSPPQM